MRILRAGAFGRPGPFAAPGAEYSPWRLSPLRGLVRSAGLLHSGRLAVQRARRAAPRANQPRSAEGSPISTPRSPLTLADWRRTVATLYARVRDVARTDPAAAAAEFRVARDALFADHPDSPIPPGRLSAWRGAAWYAYDPAWRVDARFEPAATVSRFDIPLAADGVARCGRVGTLHFLVGSHDARLALYWFHGYGGGLWLPFADATTGRTTYGGGRYLIDTIKGADLGGTAERFVLDFNFAYNPSCAYDDRWSCPLAPAENRLAFAVEAGERMPA